MSRWPALPQCWRIVPGVESLCLDLSNELNCRQATRASLEEDSEQGDLYVAIGPDDTLRGLNGEGQHETPRILSNRRPQRGGKACQAIDEGKLCCRALTIQHNDALTKAY